MKGYITQVTDLTSDVKSFHIHIPGKPHYWPGQFLVLHVMAQGKERKRAYSIASSPHWENVELLIKLHPAGKATPEIFKLEEGAVVDVDMPFGMFSLHQPFPDKVVFLAGGVGISALLSMLRYLEWSKYQGEKVLLYGNRTPVDIVHKEELDRMANEWGLKVVYTIDHPDGTGWEGETGYISSELIQENCDLRSNFYICGPPPMVAHMVQNLESLGVAHDRIKHEQW